MNINYTVSLWEWKIKTMKKIQITKQILLFILVSTVQNIIKKNNALAEILTWYFVPYAAFFSFCLLS